ncbi:MAG: hypothetical protein KJ600_02890 [Nanoarchaeota archaeon]|nr:hypothetical protein [Nanoarchaeota archaeon]MBU1103475.1 hypothetical protein [Nanoarchaeota archaeon]
MVERLGERLADRLCNYIHERYAGHSGAGVFQDRLFERDTATLDEFPIFGSYRLKIDEIDDGGKVVRAVITEGRSKKARAELAKKLSRLSVPKKYADVFTSVRVNGREDEIVVSMRFKREENSSGRTEDFGRIFHAANNTAFKDLVRGSYPSPRK